MRDRLPHERANHLPPLTNKDIDSLGVSLVPGDDQMHTSLDSLREARTPWWHRALGAIRVRWARGWARLQPVPEGECLSCEAEKAKTRHWQEKADAWADAYRALEKKLEATRERELRIPNEVDIAVAYDRPLPEQAERLRSAADASAACLDRQALDRIATPLFGSFTIPVVVADEPAPEPRKLMYHEVMAMQGPKPPPVIPDAMLEAARQLAPPPAESWGRVRRSVVPLIQSKGEIRQAEIIAARAAGGAE